MQRPAAEWLGRAQCKGQRQFGLAARNAKASGHLQVPDQGCVPTLPCPRRRQFTEQSGLTRFRPFAPVWLLQGLRPLQGCWFLPVPRLTGRSGLQMTRFSYLCLSGCAGSSFSAGPLVSASAAFHWSTLRPTNDALQAVRACLAAQGVGTCSGAGYCQCRASLAVQVSRRSRRIMGITTSHGG